MPVQQNIFHGQKTSVVEWTALLHIYTYKTQAWLPPSLDGCSARLGMIDTSSSVPRHYPGTLSLTGSQRSQHNMGVRLRRSRLQMMEEEGAWARHLAARVLVWKVDDLCFQNPSLKFVNFWGVVKWVKHPGPSTGGKGISYAGPEVLEGTRDPWGWVSLQGAPWVTVVPLAPNWFLTGLKTSLLRDTKRIANVSHLVAARHATSVRYDAERLARNSRFCRTVGSFWSTAPRRRRPGNGAFQPW